MDRPNVVFILHLPPPVHGAAMMGKKRHAGHRKRRFKETL